MAPWVLHAASRLATVSGGMVTRRMPSMYGLRQMGLPHHGSTVGAGWSQAGHSTSRHRSFRK